jgi:hypothetical protein
MENTAYIVDEACLPRRCLAIYVLLSLSLAPAGMCLPSGCQAMGIQVTIFCIEKEIAQEVPDFGKLKRSG